MTEREIFVGALQIDDPSGRRGYVAGVCGSDAALRHRVEGLLSAHGRVGDFLQQSAAATVVAAAPPPAPVEASGNQIGPYKLLEQIGEGGMGLVFMAEQWHPVRRRVALKVLKPGLDTRHVLARFEAERQALALMDHPHIAQVFDAGTAPSGRPYFVMELVRGVPITEFCDQHRLDPRRRLELFVEVCRAVQHAHQKGVIHRDLKPSNVLVTLHDTVAVPKVIDFGIAKATNQRLTERTLVTNFAQVIGTPLYMSPEQAEMNGLDVDTRSDVYALGVLLYELLAGATPFDRDRLREAGYDEMRRILRDEEPPRPSRQVGTLSAAAVATITERRGVDARQFAGLLRGDLDWIVMKALEKDRNRRYESASAFAQDVERYLADEPVQARPPSAAYRLRKFARRNKTALLAASVVAASLVAATGVSAWQAVKARDAQRQAEVSEHRATTEASIARAVNDFLQMDLLGQAASAAAPGREFEGEPYLTVKEALDRAAARIGQRFQDQPLIEAAIRTTIGAAYNSLQDNPLGVPHLERAVALRKANLGPNHEDTLASMHNLAIAYSSASAHRDAIALRQQILDHRSTLLGPDHPESLKCVHALAGSYASAGLFERSAQMLERLLEKQRAVCGPMHSDTLETMHSLALSYDFVDRIPESVALYEKVLELRETKPSDIYFTLCYAHACTRAGRHDDAERLYRGALVNNRNLGDSAGRRIGAANIRGWLARTLLLQERYDAAEPLARDAVAFHENERPDIPARFYWVSLLGAVYVGQKKYAEAEPLLLQGYEGMKQQQASKLRETRRLTEVGERVVSFYELTGQPEKASEWRAKLAAARPAARDP